jgi:hypothetical protein
MAIGPGQSASRVNFSFEVFSEVRIAPVQLLGVFPEEIGRLAVALRALDAVP